MPTALPLAILSALVLAAVALSFAAVFLASDTRHAALRRSNGLRNQLDTDRETLRGALDELAAELHDMEVPAQINMLPAEPRSGLNLGKRSQALRMYRRGEPPQQIAAALQVPLQEVELLLKVHRIVISKI